MIIAVPELSDQFKHSEAKYIAIIIAAYTVERILRENNDDLPIHELDRAILFCQPLLFGTAGAEINLHIIDGSILWKSLVIILVSDLVRFLVTYFSCYSKFYHEMSLNQKEHVFVGVTWSSKGSVQAALSQSLVTMTTQLNLNEPYPQYAAEISSTGLISILVTGPLVSIILNNFGARLLKEP